MGYFTSVMCSFFVSTEVVFISQSFSQSNNYLHVQGQATGVSSANIMSEVLRDVRGGGGGGRGGRVGGGREREGVGSEAGADSLLPIVSSQRERFKQRNTELEAVSNKGKRETKSCI